MLLCSEFEGIPNVLLEAQWLERPVVCTAAGGSAEAVRHGITGLVVHTPDAARRSPPALASSRTTNCDTAWGRRGRHHVETQFAVRRMVEGSIELYGA